MAERSDESGSNGGQGGQRLRVNGRRINFDLTTCQIMEGPPAILGRFVCYEQMADVLNAGDFYGRLFLADDPKDIRLVEAEYAYMKSKEDQMATPVAAGLHVSYGTHGVHRVVGIEPGSSGKIVILEAADGKNICVPLPRYQTETEIVAAPARSAHAPAYAKDKSSGGVIETDGSIHLDDADLDAALLKRMDALFENDDFVNALADKVVSRLGTTQLIGGQDPSGTAIANNGSDNGDPEHDPDSSNKDS